MAEETLLVMDALGIGLAALWGHSDGAVMAAWVGFLAPTRVLALVLEALQLDRGQGWREVEAAQRSLPAAQVAMLDAGHCPHARQRSGGEATRLAARFL